MFSFNSTTQYLYNVDVFKILEELPYQKMTIILCDDILLMKVETVKSSELK